MDEQRQRAEQVIAGRNAVMEALRAGREIDSLLVAKGEHTGSLNVILAKARALGIPVKEAAPVKLESLGGRNHQGVVAVASAVAYREVEDIFAAAEQRGEPPFIIVADGLEDPHNLGAVIRTAEAAGAHGVIIPKRRAAGLTHAVGKAAAGALEYVPVARVNSIAVLLDQLKERGVWIYGADRGGQSWCETDLSGAVALVVGSEGDGISRLVREKCDFILSLPMRGQINSLNASVACGVLMYEVARQRLKLNQA